MGGHLVEALLADGQDVRCILRQSSDTRWLEGLPVDRVTGCLEDTETLAAATSGVDTVYHLAAVTKATNRETYYRVNAEGTARLAELCGRRTTPPRFVYVSSAAAVGPGKPGEAVCEEDECNPVTDYGRSKLKGERELIKRADVLPFVIIRPPAVYGPRDTDMFIFFQLVNRGIKLVLTGPERILSVIFVKDLIRGILLAAKAAEKSETFHIAHEKPVTWETFADAVAVALAKDPVKLPIPPAVLWGAAALNEVGHRLLGKATIFNRQKVREMRQTSWVCNTSRSMERLGYQSTFSLEKSIEITAEWYREHGWLK
ncbi:MAG: NAD-dependent epimerase/dehydratase family protein [Candidatus Coatesbacteria bacterium]|nr:MAG: NAD-dependent epimerase/dehydratase family protein [Candidatus Coatesbacteria bacterium]